MSEQNDTIDDGDEIENDGRVNYRKTPNWRSDCGTVHLYCGDCLEVLPTLEAGSVDAVVTDPPYGLSFMGKHWDHGIPGDQFWREAIRVAKPGCHLLAFGGTRTYHRLACAIEDAGWQVRDCLGWIYGSGFPKSHNLHGQWQGWGTALKPAWEPIILARKPLAGTVAENVLQHGTGGLNIDGCRVPHDGDCLRGGGVGSLSDGWDRPWKRNEESRAAHKAKQSINAEHAEKVGRWPANIIHDGSSEVLDIIGEQSRFFYCAKASKADRDEGCEGLGAKSRLEDVGNKWTTVDYRDGYSRNVMAQNHHPTVKPTDLMRWLVRLATPVGGMVLDPFMGSGSTGKAARLEGFRFIGIERDVEYHEIAKRRIMAELNRFPLLDRQPQAEQGRLFDGDNS